MLVSFLAAGAQARAATDWRFWPSLKLSLLRDGNVDIVGARKTQDNVARLGFSIDMAATRPPTVFHFTYSPTFEAYQDQSNYNHNSHEFAATLSHEFSRRTSVDLALRGWLAYYHPIHTLDPSRPTTLVERNRETVLDLDLSGKIGIGKRSFFDWAFAENLLRYESSLLRSPTSTTASAGWGIELTRMSDAGLRVVAQHIDVERRAATKSGSVEAFYNRQWARSIQLSVDAGAGRTDTGTTSSVDPRFGVRAAYEFPKGTSVSGGGKLEVSGGWGAKSPTLDRGAYVSLRPGTRSQRFQTQTTAYFWRRTALDADAGAQDVDTLELLASFEWLPWRQPAAIGAFISHHDQNDLSGSNPALRVTYSSGGIYFRYSFLVEPGD